MIRKHFFSQIMKSPNWHDECNTKVNGKSYYDQENQVARHANNANVWYKYLQKVH